MQDSITIIGKPRNSIGDYLGPYITVAFLTIQVTVTVEAFLNLTPLSR